MYPSIFYFRKLLREMSNCWFCINDRFCYTSIEFSDAPVWMMVKQKTKKGRAPPFLTRNASQVQRQNTNRPSRIQHSSRRSHNSLLLPNWLMNVCDNTIAFFYCPYNAYMLPCIHIADLGFHSAEYRFVQ